MSETFQANGIYTLLSEGQSVELHYYVEDGDFYSTDDFVVVNGESVYPFDEFGDSLLSEAYRVTFGDDPRIAYGEREKYEGQPKPSAGWHDRVVFSLATPIDGSA